MMREMFHRTAHLMTNHLVDVDGDRASGTVLCTARHLKAPPDDQSALVSVIRYEDRYERRDGVWRDLRPLHPLPLERAEPGGGERLLSARARGPLLLRSRRALRARATS